MMEFLRKEPGIAPREVLAMATLNAAQAIDQTDALGKISPGFQADLIAIPSAETGGAVFDTIVAFDETVPWMMVDGEILKSIT